MRALETAPWRAGPGSVTGNNMVQESVKDRSNQYASAGRVHPVIQAEAEAVANPVPINASPPPPAQHHSAARQSGGR